MIPSIDLMGGKIVQLIQGHDKALESDNYDAWIARFASFPMIQLIDLDAAMGKAANREQVAYVIDRLPCQVGGGVRSIARAHELLDAGAQRVIIGSALFSGDSIDSAFASLLAHEFGADRLVFSVDSKGGQIAVSGWKKLLPIAPQDAIRALEPYCAAFLYTHVDTEGQMAGFPLPLAQELRSATRRQLIVAGGIRSNKEVDELDALGVDAVVGMAIYTGAFTV
ncbi:MAG: HisA/HisF-related TIM barrel protein [Candidatus Acidiferrales bacterium]